jgi:hypothetical protein
MTFTEQTGYTRTAPDAICQEQGFLLMAHAWSFDLNEDRFVKYFEERTGVRISWSPSCDYENPRPCSKAEWRGVVQEIMTDTETSGRIMRGKLEDAWELWQKHR